VLGLLLLVIALIVYGSLYPWEFDFHRHVNAVWLVLHNWPAALNRWVLRDTALNVLLYMPLGALAFLAMARRRHSRATMVLAAAALGMVLSVSMELLQAYDAQRDAGPMDVVTNTTGAAAGALLALASQPALESLIQRGTRRSAMAAAVLAVGWASFQLYPFFPILTSHRLRAGLAFLASGPAVQPVELWACAAEWYAIWLLLDAFDWPMRNLWMAAALLALPLRIFIPGQAIGWNDVLGAALALTLWCASPSKLRLRHGVWIMASAIVLRELAPFHFLSHAARFSWIPFYATLSSERQSAVVILLQKVFDYGAAVWVLHASGRSYACAGGLVAAALFGLELLQRYLPGRTPESTDAVLALLMALALWLASGFRPPGARISGVRPKLRRV
jgi:VanZ family protein